MDQLSSAQVPSPALAKLLRDTYTSAEIDSLLEFLTEQGTFRFPLLPTGLFAAANSTAADFEVYGYQNVWLRDNVQVAYGHHLCGETSIAAQCVRALLDFYSAHRRRFDDVIQDPLLANDAQKRPHIRFNGLTLGENPEHWSHAQNDALGYFLWLVSRLAREHHLDLTENDAATLNEFPHYFAAIRYELDADSGHWEERQKIEASSIGPVVAALEEYALLLDVQPELGNHGRHVSPLLCRELAAKGSHVLEKTLPMECASHDPLLRRDHDSALLFLAWPLNLVDSSMARTIVSQTQQHLAGPYGIRRYNGDSYWCANYKNLVSAEKRSTDYSNDQASRDSLLKQGFEAQWCLFDPVISLIAGNWYQSTRDPADLRLQTRHLNRSLHQLTSEDSLFGPYRCPESYYFENEAWGPNDMTPLLWAQSNLRCALHAMKNSVKQRPNHTRPSQTQGVSL